MTDDAERDDPTGDEIVPGWGPSNENIRPKLAAWAEESRRYLVQAAEERRTVTYRQLHTVVSEIVGEELTPRMMWRRWMSYVLEAVAKLDLANEEPLLTSLVVLAVTGDVQESGYAHAVGIRYRHTPARPALHAAIERNKCYRAFGPVQP